MQGLIDSLPASIQALGAFIAAIFIGAGALGAYHAGKTKSGGSAPADLKLIGAALANDMAMMKVAEATERIADQAAQVRAILDRASERDLRFRNDVLSRLDRLVDTVRRPPN